MKILSNYLVNNRSKYYLRYISFNQISEMLLYHNIFLENWTRAILGKDEVWFVEVLIHNQVFHNKLLNDLCAFLLNVLFLQSAFRFYSLYHVMIEVCCQNVSSKKYEQLNFLFKMNWIKMFLKKCSLLQ